MHVELPQGRRKAADLRRESASLSTSATEITSWLKEQCECFEGRSPGLESFSIMIFLGMTVNSAPS